MVRLLLIVALILASAWPASAQVIAVTETNSAAALAELQAQNFAEDTAHVSADLLVLAGVVQSAACGTALSTNGDRSLLQVESSGYLCVSDPSTQSQLGLISTDIGSIETLVLVEDAPSGGGEPGVAFLGIQRAGSVASPSAGTAGDFANVSISSDGYLLAKTVIVNGSGTELVTSDVAEDAAETAGVSGPMILSVYRATPVSSAGTAGDNATVNTDENGAIYTTPIATNAGGATPSRYISAGATEDEHAVCTGPCTLYSITVTNINAAVRYLKCENDTAANTAPGTDTPEYSIALTAGGGAAPTYPVGKFFSTALTCWLVTGAADSDVAEVSANEIMVNYDIKQ